MTLRLDGYVRVSRVGGREGEGYISPDVQREAIESYAAELGGEVAAWHSDEDYGGGNTDRPGFQAMLGRLEAEETDGIVVMKTDRFARSTADGARIVREINDRGQVFASCHERMDTRTPEGGYMLRSFLSNAELFLDQIKASWETAKGRAITRGAHIGPTPIGYLKVEPIPTKPTHISPVDSAALGGPTAPGLLVPSPVYGPAITQLFERAARGAGGDSALARWMHDTAPRQGGAHWNAGEIRRWLRSRIYLGEVRYGGLVNATAHEPLTTEKTWQRCQREPRNQRQAPSSFLLRGLVRCAGCRYAMAGASHGGAGGQTPIYRCVRSNRGCPEPSVITARRIEDLLTEAVVEHQRGLVLGRTEVTGRGEQGIEAYDAASLEVDTFVADVAARQLMGERAWQEGLRARVDLRDGLKPARDRAIAHGQALEIARKPLDDADRHGLRDLLIGMVRHVFIRRRRGAGAEDRALIIWADDPRSLDTPGPHRPGPFEPVRW